MKIEIFGPGCHRCHEVEKAVRNALAELAAEAEVEKVQDLAKIVDAGIMQTPGVRINGRMKCTGRVPKVEELKTWISEER